MIPSGHSYDTKSESGHSYDTKSGHSYDTKWTLIWYQVDTHMIPSRAFWTLIWYHF